MRRRTEKRWLKKKSSVHHWKSPTAKTYSSLTKKTLLKEIEGTLVYHSIPQRPLHSSHEPLQIHFSYKWKCQQVHQRGNKTTSQNGLAGGSHRPLPHLMPPDWFFSSFAFLLRDPAGSVTRYLQHIHTWSSSSRMALPHMLLQENLLCASQHSLSWLCIILWWLSVPLILWAVHKNQISWMKLLANDAARAATCKQRLV